MLEKLCANCKHNSNDHIYTNIQKNAIIYNMLFIKLFLTDYHLGKIASWLFVLLECQSIITVV